jgi:hypothetical protein
MTAFDAAVAFDAAIPFDGVSIPAGWRSCLQLVFGPGGVCGAVAAVTFPADRRYGTGLATAARAGTGLGTNARAGTGAALGTRAGAGRAPN